MKKFLILAVLVGFVGVAQAGGNKITVTALNTSSNAIATNTTAYLANGYIENIYIDVTAPATQTVTITAGDFTVLTATSVTADTMYYPRYPANDAAGGTYQVATNDAVKHYVYGVPFKVVVSSTQSNVVDNKVVITTRD